MRGRVLAYVCDDLLMAEINPFDAALALLALAKLGAEPKTFAPALVVHRPLLRRGRPGRAVQGL